MHFVNQKTILYSKEQKDVFKKIIKTIKEHDKCREPKSYKFKFLGKLGAKYGIQASFDRRSHV